MPLDPRDFEWVRSHRNKGTGSSRPLHSADQHGDTASEPNAKGSTWPPGFLSNADFHAGPREPEIWNENCYADFADPYESPEFDGGCGPDA